ncbi:DUF6101 family protein [Methylocystis bryophila]|uniref:Uncharacterized protein n=1 Tax=Methylocystis bryophila TaxID=655015 RepID=A0A1W6MTI5_9HYPH|nr:DUF6101 family protein [Methylocystis bryophila]ARN80887.1 hypothetical protein B1812_07125 [Methylocystis bryophila]BDV36772.1 hypothetical protein DSM21852_00250 [Methylocystis bryophila]
MFERHSTQDRNGCGQIQHDSRADGGRRVVRVTRAGVLIERRLKGVSMRISVPFTAYQGVALAVEPAPSSGVAAYRLSLAHADPDLEVLLCETKDSGAAAADWKYWSFCLDLPRLASENGEVSPVGAAKPAQIFARRRNVAVAKRRPRFLSRRSRGELARAAEVFSGEREIVCYE